MNARVQTGAVAARGIAPSRVTNRARAAIAVAAMLVLALAFISFWPTTSALAARWEDSVHRTYTHGYFVVVLSFWLLWRVRGALTDPRPNWPAALALLAIGVAWLIAWRAGVQTAHQALFPILALLGIAASSGLANAKACLVPVGYLFFAIPVWDEINPVLQWSSVFAVRTMLQVTGIPAFFVDNTFQIPAGQFEIAGGCSGLHFFIVALAVAVLYGEINRDTFKTRLALVVLAGIFAMATNWLRIYLIVVAGHLTDMQHYLVSVEHYRFGWFMFAAAMLVFFAVVRRWPAPEVGRECTAASSPTPTRLIGGLTLAGACFAAILIWRVSERNVAGDVAAHGLPSGGSITDPAAAPWRPILLEADREEQRRYEMGLSAVDAYVATYLRQQQGKELSGYGNSLLGARMRQVHAPVRDGAWNELVAMDDAGALWLVRLSYRIDDSWYASALRAQLAYGVRSLLSAPLASVVIARAPCSNECSAARVALVRFQERFAE